MATFQLWCQFYDLRLRATIIEFKWWEIAAKMIEIVYLLKALDIIEEVFSISICSMKVLRSISECKPLQFLAHLSQRLTRWAYSIPMVRRLSAVVVVHTFKLEYLWSHLANLDQILYVASLGWGKGCIRFWGRLDQNSGFQGNRKLPLAYNGENDVTTLSRLFLIQSFLYLQVTRTCIKSRTSSHFGQIGPLTMKLAALEHLKNFP